MKLSTKSRYGLRILMQVALDNRDGKLAQGRRIAERQGISEPYLEQIMIPLKSAGIVGTVRGCNGGYRLNLKPEEITVLDVIELFEGKLTLVECSPPRNPCPRSEHCPAADVWEHLSETLRAAAAEIHLSQIIAEQDTCENQDYII